MEETPREEKKKVDEDWKRRAAEEKAKLTSAAPPPAPAGKEAKAPSKAGEPAPQEAPAPPPEEPPRRGGGPFEMLVTMLVQQATMMLGLVADPLTGERYQDIGQAKMLIDMLATLRAKTKGNLNANEDRFLGSALSELQMEFVHLADAMQQQAQRKGPPRK